MSESWRELVSAVSDVEPPMDLWTDVLRREAQLAPPRISRHVRRWSMVAAAAAGVAAVIVLLALAAHSRSSSPAPAGGGGQVSAQEAGTFATQQYEDMSAGRRSLVGGSILPRTHEAVDAFWGCTESAVGSLSMDSIDVVSVHDVAIRLGGVNHPGKAVALRINLGNQHAYITRYVVEQDGRLYAAVSDAKLAQWRRGICSNP